jgi:hypothetical protein
LFIYGCSNGNNGTSSGSVSGTVTDTGGNKLAAITVTPSPTVNGVTNATTDANGNYSLTLPNGNYTLTFAKAGYATQTQSVTIVATQNTTLNVSLTQTAAAIVNVANVNFVNGKATLTATALVNDPSLKGQPATFTWTETVTDQYGNSTTSTIGTGPSITVAQPTTAAFKNAVANLVKVREDVAPLGSDLNENENGVEVATFVPLDRFQVLAIPQLAFEEAASPSYTVTATIGGQTFTATPSASIATNQLPFVPNLGIRNVPVGQPVVLQGYLNTRPLATPPVLQSTYNWTITAPTGSAVTALVDPTTRFPHFIPDVVGTYTVTETVSGKSLNLYAGTYTGILKPNGSNPLGTPDPGCAANSCHPGSTFFSTPYASGELSAGSYVQFFDTTPINAVFNHWTSSGHSKIMVRGMQIGAEYDINACGKCHSVGYAQYSSAIKDGGFKDIINASSFTNATFLANAPNFFNGYPQVLQLSEVQCETCHGPQSGTTSSGTAHGTSYGLTAPYSVAVADAVSSRISVAADACDTCHGEPLIDGRFQEWAGSAHGEYATAMSEGLGSGGVGVNSSCGGCHTGQGFPLLLAQLQGGNASRTLTSANQTALGFLTTDNVQPQVCAACHQVHDPGSVSGLVGNMVILRGDYQAGGAFAGVTPLLPSGFQADGVGEGALCITCHNSRNGEPISGGGNATVHEDGDTNWGTKVSFTSGVTTGYAAPHQACQGDVLMGRNAYFFSGPEDLTTGTAAPLSPLPVQVGQRSPHSYLADSCVTCHLQKAPTNPTLGYPPGNRLAGTNHAFVIVTDVNTPAATQINNLCTQCHGASYTGTGTQTAFDDAYTQLINAISNAIYRIMGSPASTNLVFIPGRTPQVSVNGGVPVNLATYIASAPGTAHTGAIPATGFNLELAKANWNASLVAAGYNATYGGTSYFNGAPILNSSGGAVTVIGDQSKAVHNPAFVFAVIQTTINRMNSL